MVDYRAGERQCRGAVAIAVDALPRGVAGGLNTVLPGN
jgi:hypothetical protein